MYAIQEKFRGNEKKSSLRAKDKRIRNLIRRLKDDNGHVIL